MPILPPHELYALKLSCLNYGYALFEPNPNGAYDHVRVGDVGYVSEAGKFMKLFNAFGDAGSPENDGSALPVGFEPIAERYRAKDQLEPLPPGLRKSESVQVIGGELSVSGPVVDLVGGGSMTLSCSSRCGAALITNCRGRRYTALASRAMEAYMISNFPSWMQLARDLGRPVEMHDLVFVRECILTGDWANISWNSAQCDIQVGFHVGFPNVADAGLSFWGQWQQHVEVPKRQGPCRATHVQNWDDNELDQCLFLKGMRISERAWYERVAYRLKSSTSDKLFGKERSGKPVLKSLSDRSFKITTVGAYDASIRFVQNAYDVLALYIFETSDADLALIDDNDLFRLGLHGSETLEDICKTILNAESDMPMVDVSPGEVKVGRIRWREMQPETSERINLVVLDESMEMICGASPVGTQSSPEGKMLSRPRLDLCLPSEMDLSSELSRESQHPANSNDDQLVTDLQDNLTICNESEDPTETLLEPSLDHESQEHQPVSPHSTTPRNLSDSPPRAALPRPSPPPSHPPPPAPRDGVSDRLLLSPGSREDTTPSRPSSRRELTRALELAREAVRLDSTNDDPLGAIKAYGESVRLLNEVMERVMRGEDTERRRNDRKRSIVAQEEEVRKLKSIHDTYADRMNILSLIYSAPTDSQLSLHLGQPRPGSRPSEALRYSQRTMVNGAIDTDHGAPFDDRLRASSNQSISSDDPLSRVPLTPPQENFSERVNSYHFTDPSSNRSQTLQPSKQAQSVPRQQSSLNLPSRPPYPYIAGLERAQRDDVHTLLGPGDLHDNSYTYSP